MSRVGRKPIQVPSNTKVSLEDGLIKVEGPKGKLEFQIPAGIEIELDEDVIVVKRSKDEKKFRALHGLTRAIINNMLVGVTQGHQKELEIVGVGFRAQMKGKSLLLQIGFSHPVEYPLPEGITIEVPNPTTIVVKGIDKQKVGEVAAEIRAFYPPEPYKGKGIRYRGEYVRKKAGKAGLK
jgi:large subunit ribosomal protein L6